eukprot:PhF_6_TR1418/c0_g2_i3/m.2487
MDWLRNNIWPFNRTHQNLVQQQALHIVDEAQNILWNIDNAIQHVEAELVAAEATLERVEDNREKYIMECEQNCMALHDFDADVENNNWVEQNVDGEGRSMLLTALQSNVQRTMDTIQSETKQMLKTILNLEVRKLELLKQREQCEGMSNVVRSRIVVGRGGRGDDESNRTVLLPMRLPDMEMTTTEMIA